MRLENAYACRKSNHLRFFMMVKTRFAPSPTGYLHIGGARTALYSWLFARHFGGQFILRIEDTDRERSTETAIDAILKGMEWLGLDYNGEVPFQMKRLARYREVAEQLIAKNQAYYCDCSKERLEAMRNQQIARGEKPRYDGHCRERHLKMDNQTVVRLRNPDEGEVSFHDLVHGEITIANQEIDDLVLLRSDGIPTYNFAVVVDDSDMEITHVIRGDDHINNTPRQINILRALNLSLPIYAHVPMILGDDGKRLSKRHGAVSVLQYRDEGYLPEALLNYLLRLGWSHGDQEIFSRAEMVELFNLEHINHSPATFNPEKLLWLNQHYIKTLDKSYLANNLKNLMSNQKFSDQPDLAEVVDAQRDRAKTLIEMAEKSWIFYEDFVWDDAKKPLLEKLIPVKQELAELSQKFAALNEWTREKLHQTLADFVAEKKLSLGKIGMPLRIAVTGDSSSPSIDLTLYLLGKEKVLQRMQSAIEALSNSPD